MLAMTKWFILNGHEPEPVSSLEEWMQRFEGQNRRVADTETSDGRVSTVFLGLDHSFGDGPPLIFESMIFGGQHDGEMRRYSTWAEAEQGHAEMVVLARPVH